MANHGCGQSLIDYIAINEKYFKAISRCKVVHRVDKLSDHYPVVAKVKIKMAKPKRYTKAAKTDREWLKDENNKRIFQEATITETNEFTWKEISYRIKKGAEKVMPKQTMERRQNWMTDEILELMYARRKEKNKEKIRDMTRQIRQKCREAKTREIENICDKIHDLENRNETRKMYLMTKRLASKSNMKSANFVLAKNRKTSYQRKGKKAKMERIHGRAVWVKQTWNNSY